MKWLWVYPENERRATLTGVNLFFSALLGANLGAITEMPLGDYTMMVVILVGAVTGVLTIAVSKRPAVIWSTAAALAIMLASIILFTDAGVAGREAQLDRIAITIAVWLALLVLLRMTPSAEEVAAKQAQARIELGEEA